MRSKFTFLLWIKACNLCSHLKRRMKNKRWISSLTLQSPPEALLSPSDCFLSSLMIMIRSSSEQQSISRLESLSAPAPSVWIWTQNNYIWDTGERSLALDSLECLHRNINIHTSLCLRLLHTLVDLTTTQSSSWIYHESWQQEKRK